MREQVISLFNDYFEQLNDNFLPRVLTSVFMFDFLDRLRLTGFQNNWQDLLTHELSQLQTTCAFLENSFDNSLNNFKSWTDDSPEDIQEKTGLVYFNLWKDFTKEEYFKQATEIQQTRFHKNNISVEGVKHALDDGCGGGRYSLALKKLGCAKVTGVDVSSNSVNFANSMNPYDKKEVTFLNTSVLDLPFKNEHFDFVFSNGVLHHTYDTEQGLKEIYRVLNKNGRCWLYLYGGKNSFFWDTVDFCRRMLSIVPQAYTQEVMKIMGYPPGRIFHRCDFFYVPINNRYLAYEVEAMLTRAGFKDFRRLQRGAEHDWDEIIFINPDIDNYIYGEGEMRYMISK